MLRFDPQRELFTTYYESDGLPSNSVSAILEDHNGNLWVSTAGGLSRFNPRTKTFTNYDEADGLTSDNFEGFPVAYQTRRGQMFFGNSRGLTSFWPDQIVEKPFVPPVVLTGFSLLNRPVAPGPGSLLANSITFTRVVDAVSRAEHILVRVRCSELSGSATEPVSVHAGGTRPFLDPGGLRSPDCYLHDVACGRLHAARSGFEQSRGVERAGGCPAAEDPSSLVGHMVVSRCFAQLFF